MVKIVGDGDNNILSGGASDDFIIGRGGDDTLEGNLGNDFLLGGGGIDTLFGGRGDDVLFGGQGNDILFGGKNADYLSGDRGSDTLHGGRDADVFAFKVSGSNLGDGVDTVEDFSFGEDRLQLEDGDVSNVTTAEVGSDLAVYYNGTQFALLLNTSAPVDDSDLFGVVI